MTPAVACSSDPGLDRHAEPDDGASPSGATGGAPGAMVATEGTISAAPETAVVSELEPQAATAACEQVAEAREAAADSRRQTSCLMEAHVGMGSYDSEDPVGDCQSKYEACLEEWSDFLSPLDCTDPLQLMTECEATVNEVNTCLSEGTIAGQELIEALACEVYTPTTLASVEVGQTPESCRDIARYCWDWIGLSPLAASDETQL